MNKVLKKWKLPAGAGIGGGSGVMFVQLLAENGVELKPLTGQLVVWVVGFIGGIIANWWELRKQRKLKGAA